MPRLHPSQARGRHGARRGAILLLTAFLIIVMLALLALSIDTGYMYSIQAQLDRSVDAAALAGAASLVDGQTQASDKVVEYLVRNPVGSSRVITDESQIALAKLKWLEEHEENLQISTGQWNAETGQLEPDSTLPSALEVTVSYPNMPLFFARALGRENFTVQASAIAMYQPRDIMVVLDFSGSMNDDSELKSINSLGREAVEDNLEQIYTELGSPQYGNMQFDPQYITVVGQPPQNGSQPQITVEYRYRSVYITSTKDLSNVVLELSNGNRVKFDGLSGTTGTFSYQNRPVYKVWVKSGSNESGEGPGYGEPFSFYPSEIKSVIRGALGLNDVDYPYPSGSWNGYIDYCRSSSGANEDAGYRYQFGYMNLINYWLEDKAAYHQTPDLWKVSAQPVTAVKDAVDVFMDFLRQVPTNDRVGLAVYNSSSGEGVLEFGLTEDLDAVANTARARQAGHYHSMTNIGAGLHVAREELEENGRVGAFKMVVLMTDGNANWVNGSSSVYWARQYVVDEANLCAEKRYPVMTISLGAGADTELMDQIAEITEAVHFNVPGGQPVSDYRDDLIDVFRQIAGHRPLKLVK